MSETKRECRRCGAAQESYAAVFGCPRCHFEICDSCKGEHRCGEIYCGHCDDYGQHSTQNCMLPVYN